jgi:signal transduction histidine kinase
MEPRILAFITIILSALLFTVPLVLFNRIRKLDQAPGRARYWLVLLVFCAVFYAGYVWEAVHLLQIETVLYDDWRVVGILAGGSLFVLLVAVMFHGMVSRLDMEIRHRAHDLTKAYKNVIARQREAERLKDHFVFVAAHELRTPVTSLRWSLDLIKESPVFQGANSEMQGIIKMITNSVLRLTGLVNDLLDTSRLDYGTIELKPEPVKVGEFVEAVVADLKPIAAKEKIELTVELGRTGDREVLADKRRLRDVLTNLIANSLKFTPAGGWARVCLTHDDQEVVFGVCDNGAGLDEADMDKLFKKFSRPDNHPKDKEIESTGLGLYITRTLVEKWGGRIWAESAGRGHGSSFRFTVPFELPQSGKAAAEEPDPPTATESTAQ